MSLNHIKNQSGFGYIEFCGSLRTFGHVYPGLARTVFIGSRMPKEYAACSKAVIRNNKKIESNAVMRLNE